MRFFNTTLGPLALAFNSGKSVIAMAQSWFDVPAHEAGSASIAQHLKKGHSVQSKFVAESEEKQSIIKVEAPSAAPIEDSKVSSK